mmetsp:Transcript_12084/g.25954  ORF Transcript_12084/g.25954 Transcript_12084/m.25954 type:complete len:271 (+) Transcript_12084:114-926(+)
MRATAACPRACRSTISAWSSAAFKFKSNSSSRSTTSCTPVARARRSTGRPHTTGLLEPPHSSSARTAARCPPETAATAALAEGVAPAASRLLSTSAWPAAAAHCKASSWMGTCMLSRRRTMRRLPLWQAHAKGAQCRAGSTSWKLQRGISISAVTVPQTARQTCDKILVPEGRAWRRSGSRSVPMRSSRAGACPHVMAAVTAWLSCWGEGLGCSWRSRCSRGRLPEEAAACRCLPACTGHRCSSAKFSRSLATSVCPCAQAVSKEAVRMC